MNLPRRTVILAGAIQLLFAAALSAQILTQGPVVGGVAATEAKVFVRTDQAATVALRYGTNPELVGAIDTDTLLNPEASDFTTFIPLTDLTAETTYYLNVLVNGVPQFAAEPFPFFTTFAPAGAATRVTSSLSSWPTSARSPN